jgi:hypothetical protein
MLSYLKKTQGLETHRWPKLVIEEKLVRRKSTWMKQNDKWMQKWDINIQACPDNIKEIKKFVNEKFRNILWTRHIGRKKSYYIKEFNPTSSHDEKAYIRAPINWKAKMLMAQIRTSSHQLRCETGRWQVPKEEWADRTCLFCNMGTVETEQHFVMECLAYNDIRSDYTKILQNKDFNYLFEEDQVKRTADLIIKIQRRRDKLTKTLQLTSLAPDSGG